MWPFSLESALREIKREIAGGNKHCYLKHKWYGWIVVHKPLSEEDNE